MTNREKVFSGVIGMLLVAIIVLGINLANNYDDGCSIDTEKATKEVKNLISYRLSKGVVSFTDICFAMYSGTIGDTATTQVLFGKKSDLSLQDKVDECVKYTMATGHNLFTKAKENAMSDCRRVCACFFDQEGVADMMKRAESVIDGVLADANVEAKAISSVKRNLKSRIKASTSIIPKSMESESGDDWEQLLYDVASMASKAAVKIFF